MNKVSIYHNPQCTKSRQALEEIKKSHYDFEVIEYLKKPLSQKEIKDLLGKLNMEVTEIIRKEEAIYKEKFKGSDFTNEEWLEILETNPKLIQRPIVVLGEKAAIGRPLENVIQLLNS
jgi:arsenate reductase (glutaredoxin)